jgi:oligogalacturonide transporter
MKKNVAEQTNPDALPLKTKLLIGLGDIYGGGGFQLVGFLYAIFLSDTIGLNMMLIPIVLLVGKVWDAILDPMMGRITDNTKSRWGRRRPFFLFGFIAVTLSFIFLFSPFFRTTR